MVITPSATDAVAPLTTPQGRTRAGQADRATRRREQLRSALSAPVEVETTDTIDERIAEIHHIFRPRNAWQAWITSRMAVTMTRIDRCDRVERRLRDWASFRALDFWDDDQALEVAKLAARLDKNPARVVAQLKRSPAGCEWLLHRWRLLGQVAPTAWTEDQQTQARLLVGGDVERDPCVPGFAAGQVADLEAQRERVREADAILRSLVEADLCDEGVPGLARLRRYARSLERHLTWCLDQFHAAPAGGHGDPDRWQAASAAAGDTPDEPCDETKPFPQAPAQPQRDETNPIAAAVPSPPAQTKPPGRVELAPNLASALPEVLANDEVDPAVFTSEPGTARGQRRRANPAQEAAQREKATRRRAALGCGSGL